MNRSTPPGYVREMRNVRPPSITADSLKPLPEVLSLRLDLRLITPMIGGGVQAMEPDKDQPVRPSAIRGALRWWWRALQPEPEAARLKLWEQRLFGGVGEQSRASLIRVEVGDVKGVGSRPVVLRKVVDVKEYDQSRSEGTWNMRELAYAAFPLRSEAGNPASAISLTPKSIIQDMSFVLKIRVDDRRWAQLLRELGDAGSDILTRKVLSVLTSIHWWVHFGGLGGRTRRGFGALALDNVLLTSGLGAGVGDSTLLLERAWKQLPSVKTLGISMAPPGRPSLFGAQILARTGYTAAELSHKQGIMCLKDFRQLPGFARSPTQRNRPGRSYWPEPDLLKILREKGRGLIWSHDVHGAARTVSLAKPGGTERLVLATPRAVFGLPLHFRFTDKTKRDCQADANVLPENGNRWPSPLFIRPHRDNASSYSCLFLVLGPNSRPQGTKVTLINSGNSISDHIGTTGYGGARHNIETYLRRNDGDALDAFCDWVKKERSFRDHETAEIK